MKHKTQHYVPRSYLAEFVDPETPEEQTPYVWVYELSEEEVNKPYRKAPKNVAEESFYYSFSGDDGELDHGVEKALSKLESAGIEVLRRLDNGMHPSALTSHQRGDFAAFVGFMAGRVPVRRNQLEDQVGAFAEKIFRFAAGRKDYFHRTMREAMAEKGKKMDEDEIEAIRQRVLEEDTGSFRGTSEMSLRMMVKMAPIEGISAHNLAWRILEAPDGHAFLTSDNPLVKVSTERLPPPWGWGTGWETPWMEAIFPLTPSACLLMSKHHPPGREIIAPDRVREINLRTVSHAGAEVYSSTERPVEEVLSRPSGWSWWTPVTDVTWDTQAADASRPDNRES